jgi:predicted RNase H-like HicB family nuclease
MNIIRFTSWKDEQFFIGFLNDYPDYKTQGESKEDLIENLRDLWIDLESEEIPYIRHVEELQIA